MSTVLERVPYIKQLAYYTHSTGLTNQLLELCRKELEGIDTLGRRSGEVYTKKKLTYVQYRRRLRSIITKLYYRQERLDSIYKERYRVID